ncbi:MAG TPA: hypothetical protein VKF36_03630, partial [Syntrophorhabdales bacterium]|nr:hypothetical protein [Syntrophorhabdales bacterium]
MSRSICGEAAEAKFGAPNFGMSPLPALLFSPPLQGNENMAVYSTTRPASRDLRAQSTRRKDPRGSGCSVVPMRGGGRIRTAPPHHN